MLPYAPTKEGWIASQEHIDKLMEARIRCYVKGTDPTPEEQAEWEAVVAWRRGVMILVAEEATSVT